MPEQKAQTHNDRLTIELIEEAVAEGIRRAVSDPRTWEAAGAAMREQAHSAAGGWILGGVATLLKRVAWVVVIVSGVYALGGWAAVAALFKTQGVGQ
jgi:hypothetical protein